MFVDSDAQSPFDRLSAYGFRCMKNLSTTASISEALTQPIDQLTRDYDKEKPVSAQIFEIFKRFYAYDRTDLKSRLEFTDDTPESWRRNASPSTPPTVTSASLRNSSCPKTSRLPTRRSSISLTREQPTKPPVKTWRCSSPISSSRADAHFYCPSTKEL